LNVNLEIAKRYEDIIFADNIPTELKKLSIYRDLNPGKPYNPNEASELFSNMRNIILENEQKLRLKEEELRKKNEEELSKACRKLAEKWLQLYVWTEEEGTTIDPSIVPITGFVIDPITKAKFSMKDIITTDFVRSIDPRIDLNGYLRELRDSYDGFKSFAIFERPLILNDKIWVKGKEPGEDFSFVMTKGDPPKIINPRFHVNFKLIWRDPLSAKSKK